MQSIVPFLWFDRQAEEAVAHYVSIFDNASTGKLTHYTEDGLLPKGSVMTVDFSLAGQPFVALNGGPKYQFSPAISLLIHCESAEQAERVRERLATGGRKQPGGWLIDKYGVSWQVAGPGERQ